MSKNILLAVLLVIVAFIFGMVADHKFAPFVSFFAARSPSTSTGSSILGGPVTAVTQTVNGKAVAVNGKSMTVEADGQRVTIKMGEKVNIVKPMANPLPATPSAAPKPTDFSFADFATVPVGSQVSAMLELSKDGTFLTKSVFLVPAPVNK